VDKDIRWKQRLENYKKAFSQLDGAVRRDRECGLNELEKQGLVQAFEYSFELAWNVMKDYLDFAGFTAIVGSRGAVRCVRLLTRA
jgi:hypothetical protein